MRAGALKHKIIFQEKDGVTNSVGEVLKNSVDVLTCYASIQTISGKEQFLSNQNYSTLSHKVRVRYSNLINSKQQILFGNRVFKILAVLNPFEQNKELEILCEEVVK